MDINTRHAFIQTNEIKIQIVLIQQVVLILNQLLLTVTVPRQSRHIYLKIVGRMNSGFVFLLELKNASSYIQPSKKVKMPQKAKLILMQAKQNSIYQLFGKIH